MRPDFQVDYQQDMRERVLLLGVQTTFGTTADVDFQAALAETIDLLHAAGGKWIDTVCVKREKIQPALLIGKGKAAELAEMVRRQNIDLLLVNHELSPTQERNLEQMIQCRVLDRVGLILSIFAARARTQEGKLQVELAQLTHLSSRLVRGYGHLQSQKGGIGLKGPGETRLETDRRLIAQKLTRLRKRLKEVKKQRAVQSQNRQRSKWPTFALVGYTNAGKSTLFNRLTKANVIAKDQLFATLDTTARKLWLDEQTSIILTDTVGFVRDLPHTLIAAFSATLEETAQADCLLHIVDASGSHPEQHIEEVDNVLRDIGAADVPRLMIYNKTDRLPETQQHYGMISARAVGISAHTAEGLPELRRALIDVATHINQIEDISNARAFAE